MPDASSGKSAAEEASELTSRRFNWLNRCLRTILLALDEALTELAQRDPPAAELVQLRFFAGLTQQQAADLLGISPRTAARTWAYARAWLFQQIAGDQQSGV